ATRHWGCCPTKTEYHQPVRPDQPAQIDKPGLPPRRAWNSAVHGTAKEHVVKVCRSIGELEEVGLVKMRWEPDRVGDLLGLTEDGMVGVHTDDEEALPGEGNGLAPTSGSADAHHAGGDLIALQTDDVTPSVSTMVRSTAADHSG